MSRQFKRYCELVVSPEFGDTRVIKDLRFSFEITKSIIGYPNMCMLSIYNPNEDTIYSLSKKFTEISFNAGYEGNVRLLFKGQIRNVLNSRRGVDTILTIYAGDGEQDWQNSIFNKTFSESVSISSVIKDVISSFKNISEGSILGLPSEADKIRGQTLSGSSKDILNQFAKEYGFSWSIQDGEMVVVPDNEALDIDEAVVISSSTGMIGSPTITEIGANVTCLLNPELMPNKAFVITSSSSEIEIGNLYFRRVPKTSAEGTYKIQEVVFKGDSRVGDFLSTVKGISL